jgi:hypothetical protein
MQFDILQLCQCFPKLQAQLFVLKGKQGRQRQEGRSYKKANL